MKGNMKKRKGGSWSQLWEEATGPAWNKKRRVVTQLVSDEDGNYGRETRRKCTASVMTGIFTSSLNIILETNP